MTEANPPSRALQALTAAALALPGMTAAHGADAPSFNVQLGHYLEGKRDLDGQSYQSLDLKPLSVDSFAVQGIVPLTDRLSLKANFTQDSWSGATPVTTLPSAAVKAQLISGASSPNYFHIDENGTPNVLDFSQYDPNTDTYGHYAHPGLVHIMASASPETRRQWDGSLTQEWNKAELTVGGGISDEYDFLSRFVNVGGKFDFNNKLTVLNWGASYTWDRIRASIAANSAANSDNYADQIRDLNGQPTIFGQRRDFAANAGVTQILNQDAVVQADLSYTRSSGLLANPYKAAVFAFDDPDEPFDHSGLKYIPIKGLIEQRPNLRNQWALNVRLAQHLPSDGAVHISYRYFRDNWGIHSHTLEASVDQPLGGGWMLTPDARYYSQTAADFYAPYFLLHEAYPFHPGGGLVPNSPVTLKYFSSDERLSAFGALSGSLAVQKSLGHGIALDLSYEYYVHKGKLKLGGGGEGAFADFHSSLVTAGLAVDLARRQDQLAAPSDGVVRPDAILGIRPAGLLMPEILRPGALAVSVDFVGKSWKRPVELDGRAAVNDELIANACGASACTLAPTNAGSNVVKFDLSYALRPWITLTVSPTYVERSVTLVDVFPDSLGALPPLGGPSGSGRHSTSSWGDTTLLASFDLTPKLLDGHARVGAGVSVPTGEAGRRLNGKTDFVGYSLQTGSGTWDAIAAVDIEGARGIVRAGVELGAVKRLAHANHFGYRLGDQLRGDLWTGADVLPWLAVTARLATEYDGKIHGAYEDHLEKNVPFTELQQVDYDVNGDGVVDSQDMDYVTVYRDAFLPHVVASPDDLPANHGGTFVDAGIGLTLHALGGPFRGDRVSVEWLKPVYTNTEGYQLRRGNVINAKVSIAL